MGFFSKLFGLSKVPNVNNTESTNVSINISLSSIPDKMGELYVVYFTDGSSVKWKPLYNHEVEGLRLANNALKQSENQFIVSYLQKCIKSWTGVLDLNGKRIPCTWLMIKNFTI